MKSIKVCVRVSGRIRMKPINMTALFRFVSGDFAGANFSRDLVLTNQLLTGTHKVSSQPSKCVPMVITNHHTSHTVTRKHHQKTKHKHAPQQARQQQKKKKKKPRKKETKTKTPPPATTTTKRNKQKKGHAK